MPLLSCLYTSARPHLIEGHVRKWLSLASNQSNIEFIVSVDARFAPQVSHLHTLPNTKILINPGRPSAVEGWNLAARKATGDIFIQVSDDLAPPQGYEQKIFSKLDVDKSQTLCISDGMTASTTFMPHFICTRVYYNQFGYLFFPGYHSMFSDNEAADVAHAKQTVLNGMDIVFHHTHGQLRDDVARAHEGKNYAEGNALYALRKPNAFFPWFYTQYFTDDGNSDGIYSPNWYTKNSMYHSSPRTPDVYLGLHTEALRRRKTMFPTSNPRPEFQVLIPTLPQRKPFFDVLVQELMRQGVSFIADERTNITVGAKRNSLIEKATAPYICFVDDDDWISHDYAEKICDAINLNKQTLDVVLFDVLTTVDKEPPMPSYLSFEIGNKNLPQVYVRQPNHLMVWKREHALKEKFPDINRTEDSQWADKMKVHAHKWARIYGFLYFYEFLRTNTTTQR